MATQRVPLFGFQMNPDQSGVCWIAKADLFTSNDVWKHDVLVLFDDTATKGGCYGAFTVPKDYVSAPKIILVWTASVTTGAAKFQIEYRTVGGDDTTSLDQAGVEETVSVTDNAPGAAFRRLEASMTLTQANFALDEMVTFFLTIRGDDAATTIASNCLIYDALFEYSNT